MLTDPMLRLDQVDLTLLGELSKHDVRVRDRLPVVLRRAAEIAAR
jgi:hypothetical protein